MWSERLRAVLVTLWVGGLWVTGLVVAPTLFSVLPDRVTAGEVAGHLFRHMAWIGIGCGALLLLQSAWLQGFAALRRADFWLVLAMLALVALGQFGIAPVIEAIKLEAGRDVMQSLFAERFARWHGISSAVYLVECGLGLLLVTRSRR